MTKNLFQELLDDSRLATVDELEGLGDHLLKTLLAFMTKKAEDAGAAGLRLPDEALTAEIGRFIGLVCVQMASTEQLASGAVPSEDRVNGLLASMALDIGVGLSAAKSAVAEARNEEKKGGRG